MALRLHPYCWVTADEVILNRIWLDAAEALMPVSPNRYDTVPREQQSPAR
jgi:hypothetical protein